MLRGRLVAVLVVPVLLASTLSACGHDDSPPTAAKPSKAVTACRDKWQQLGKDIAPQVALTQPSALPRRWNTVAATVDYYRTSATSADCGTRLDDQEKAIAALRAFTARLTVFDMEAKLAGVQAAAQAYAAGPWPAAPTPTPKPGSKKHNKKQPKPERPPKPALVGAALKALTTQAPVATQQQGPGWEQASVVDLDDKATTAKAVKDLGFLSTESSAWRACKVALLTISAALAAPH